LGVKGTVNVPAAGSVDYGSLDTTFVPTMFRKNVIINGGMDIWQRGTSFTSQTTSAYETDRFDSVLGNSGTWDITRSSDVPTVAEAGVKFNYSWKADCTTADGTVDPADTFYFEQKVEGYNYKFLYQQNQTFSFWIKTNKTGVYCVALGSSDRTYVSETTVTSADTWEKKTVTITTAPSAGTWNFTNGVGLFVEIVFVNGSSRVTTTTDAWQSGFFASTSNQVNLADSTSNYIQITGVQLEKGTVATEFEYRPIGEELALCQRYYERWDSSDTIFANVSDGYNISTTAFNCIFDFKQKRSAASITASAANTFQVFNGGTIACTSTGFFQTTDRSTELNFAVASGLTAGSGGLLRANNTTTAYIDISSEL